MVLYGAAQYNHIDAVAEQSLESQGIRTRFAFDSVLDTYEANDLLHQNYQTEQKELANGQLFLFELL